jgi:transcription elongation factor Elf1
MPTVSMKCLGCNREFEVVEVSCSFVDEDMAETVECPTCGKAVQGRPSKIYVNTPVQAGMGLFTQKHSNR